MNEFSECFLILLNLIKDVKNLKIKGYQKQEDYEILLMNYKGIHGELHFKEDGFICVSMTPYNKEFSDVIYDFLEDCFEVIPCISYEETCEDGTVLYCREWVSMDEDSHILRFINSYNKGLVQNTTNIKILTDKTDEYYQEKLGKMPGIYQGCLSDEERDFYKTCSEYNLFSEIRRKATELRQLQDGEEGKDLSDYSLEEEEIRFALEYLFVQTSRFGTKVGASDDYSPVMLDIDYAIWLNSWNNYIVNCLDREDFYVLEEMASNLEDVYPYLTTINSNMYEDGIKHILISKRLLDEFM